MLVNPGSGRDVLQALLYWLITMDTENEEKMNKKIGLIPLSQLGQYYFLLPPQTVTSASRFMFLIIT